ncbi:hypothetical protein C1H46_044135 [Malus baccata]|uniref:Uncharacterized protein n=1 Tax=Malus baccata TaxID=106549 RepID=A0A540K815_MALBA|nr:hypothetical protein C1H46_044135 [Malus baccata]
MVKVPKLWNYRSCQRTLRGTALMKPLLVLFPACRSLFIDSKPLMIPTTKKQMKNFFFCNCNSNFSSSTKAKVQYETLPSDDEDSEDIDGNPLFRSDADGKSSIALSGEHIGVNDGDHTY